MKFTLKLSLAFALACVPALAAPVSPGTGADCLLNYQDDLAIARADAASESGAKLFDYGDDDSAKLVFALNATAPVSAFVAERVLVLIHRDGEVKVAFIRDGCAAEAFLITPRQWSDLMAVAAGI
jgi:hypothetical protein